MPEGPSLAHDPREVLRRHFGYPGFRPGQQELVRAVLSGSDAVGVLPTGGGKSVCYQVPAAMLEHLTVVVSPLVSLMADQVRRAREGGIPTVALHSGLSSAEVAETERALTQGAVRLLLLAPERFHSRRFQLLMPRLKVSLLTIDEAHCISMWGHDFRPSYRELGTVRSQLGAPVLALTATATPRVQREIEISLGMRDPIRVVGGFDRANLLWAVRTVRGPGEKEPAIRALISMFGGARLVYAATRGRVERIRSSLAHFGLRAEAYHAGLPTEERSRVQDYFLSADNPLVIATNAFGMGIDRPDVRLVVHDQLPGSIEDYYQEAGRAGRDGSLALCAAFFMRQDRRVHRSFLDETHPPLRLSELPGLLRTGIHGSRPQLSHRLRRRSIGRQKLDGVARYATSRRCRRSRILQWFGERPESGPCSGCDRCEAWERLLERTGYR